MTMDESNMDKATKKDYHISFTGICKILCGLSILIIASITVQVIATIIVASSPVLIPLVILIAAAIVLHISSN